MLIVLAGLYLLARVPGEAWPWLPVVAFAYLIPVSTFTLYWSRRAGLFASLLASATLIAALAYGWQQGRPPYLLAILGGITLLLPAWAALIAPRGTRRQRNDRDRATGVEVRELVTLDEIRKTILSSLDIDATLDEIMAQVEHAFQVEAGSLLLEEEGKLTFEVSFGPVAELVRPLVLDIGQGIAGWVVMTGTSVLLIDAKQDGRHFDGVDHLTGYETHSLLCVPLKGPEDRAIGAIELMNPLDGTPFGQQDQELLESVAAFAALAIENARLYAQTICHATDLSSLHQVGKTISASLDIRDTVQTVAPETARLTGAARSRILLFDSQSERISYAAAYGFPSSSEDTLTYEQACRGLNGWVMQEKTPTLSADVHSDERMGTLSPEQIAGPGARSMVVAPLLIKGEPVGTLSAIRLQNADPFTERELGLLNMVAGQAAIALENAHLFEERRRQITELSILNQTGQALSCTLQPTDLVELIYTQVAQVLDARNFYIALYDPEQDVVRFPLAYEHGVRKVGPGLKPQAKEWQPRQHGRGITEYIIQTKRALWIPNHVRDRLAELGIEMIGEPARSWLGVPILWGDRALGVIAVQNDEQEDVYDSEHRDLLMTIAGQASAALRNTQLFAEVNSMTGNLERLVEERTEALARANEELTVERDRLNVLYQITRQLATSLDPERMLDNTLGLISRALQAQQSFVLLQDSARQHLVYSIVAGATPPAEDGTPFPMPREGERVDHRQDSSLIESLVSRQDSVRIGDITGDRHWHLVSEQDRWHRSLLATPLLTGNEVVGAIVLYHAKPDHFTADHQRMFDAIAAQVAIAVSNAEMFQLLREAADRLGKLLRTQQLEAAKSHAILEGVADGVMVTDAQGEITLFNAAAERILQLQRTDVIGRSVSELPGIFGLAGTSWPRLTELWGQGRAEDEKEVLSDSHPHDERLELDERVVSMRVAPVVRQGTFEGTVAVFRDITKDVEVDRMKSEFVSSVSHELRTPMTSIKGYIDLLYSGMAGPMREEQKRFLEVVRANADRLTLLLNDLLDISRIETGRLKLSIESIDVRDIVDLVVSNHQPEADKRQQSLMNTVTGPLPLVRADPDRTTQILTNLVSNAIYYTPVEGTITVGAEAVEGYVNLYVQDTGVGIREEDKARLFTRFFRADTPLVQARSGTGLGLAIVKSIVELHGGQIWFDSTYGKGSTFSFSLPLADQQVSEAGPRKFRTISYRSQDKRILIVGDDLAATDAIAQRLRHHGGYRVNVQRSGREALEELRSETYHADLILLDLNLPDMENTAFLQRVLSHKSLSAIPVIALSLSHREQIDAKAYVSRPVRAHRLVDAVNTVFAERIEDLDRRAGSVMIVDANRQLAELFTMVLTQKGYTVNIERDYGRLFQAAKARQPDMIMLDIQGPGEGGLDALRSLRDAPETRDIPVLVITSASTDAEASHSDLDIQALEFADGPTEADQLFAEIRQALEDREGKDLS
jgi:PAS domain S-box-containing protein